MFQENEVREVAVLVRVLKGNQMKQEIIIDPCSQYLVKNTYWHL